jgi:hypothetical protein
MRYLLRRQLLLFTSFGISLAFWLTDLFQQSGILFYTIEKTNTELKVRSTWLGHIVLALVVYSGLEYLEFVKTHRGFIKEQRERLNQFCESLLCSYVIYRIVYSFSVAIIRFVIERLHAMVDAFCRLLCAMPARTFELTMAGLVEAIRPPTQEEIEHRCKFSYIKNYPSYSCEICGRTS